MSIAARIIGDANETALGAALDMAAERRGAARLDRAHDAPFGAAEMAGVYLAIRLAVAAEDIRYLERGHGWSASVWRRCRQLQPVELAGRVADHGGCDLGITCRGRQMLMAEQHLDRADIGAGFEQMGGKAVAQRMDAHRLSELRRLASIPARQWSVLTWSGWLSSRP